MEALSPERARYDVDDRFYDEAFAARGEPHPHYRAAIEALEQRDLRVLESASADAVRERGAYFGDNDAFAVDPVPRVLSAEEWSGLAAGLTQRVRALNAFLADIYGERRIVAAGVLPARVVESADHYEPWMAGVAVRGPRIAAAGLDVVRDASGRFMVLEDNVRTPSGIAYAEVAREVVGELLDRPGGDDFGPSFEALGAALRAAAPAGIDDPNVVLLSDGESNSAWFEHRRIARRLGIPIVTFADLDIRDGRVFARHEGRREPVDVIYRRTD
ncbi:MAG TPA: circularly permuted type 2 ATP-grasp protein, partial [Thermoleophilaceae bacterium]